MSSGRRTSQHDTAIQHRPMSHGLDQAEDAGPRRPARPSSSNEPQCWRRGRSAPDPRRGRATTGAAPARQASTTALRTVVRCAVPARRMVAGVMPWAAGKASAVASVTGNCGDVSGRGLGPAGCCSGCSGRKLASRTAHRATQTFLHGGPRLGQPPGHWQCAARSLPSLRGQKRCGRMGLAGCRGAMRTTLHCPRRETQDVVFGY